jgi:hypothetical protein
VVGGGDGSIDVLFLGVVDPMATFTMATLQANAPGASFFEFDLVSITEPDGTTAPIPLPAAGWLLVGGLGAACLCCTATL